MTSCLRMAPKFSTPYSLAMLFNSVIGMPWSLAMLSEWAILSRHWAGFDLRPGLGRHAGLNGAVGGWSGASSSTGHLRAQRRHGRGQEFRLLHDWRWRRGRTRRDRVRDPRRL